MMSSFESAYSCPVTNSNQTPKKEEEKKGLCERVWVSSGWSMTEFSMQPLLAGAYFKCSLAELEPILKSRAVALPVAWKPPPSLRHSQPHHHHRQPLFIIFPFQNVIPGFWCICLLVGGFFVVLFIIYHEKTQSVSVKPGDSVGTALGRRCVAVLGTGI